MTLVPRPCNSDIRNNKIQTGVSLKIEGRVGENLTAAVGFVYLEHEERGMRAIGRVLGWRPELPTLTAHWRIEDHGRVPSQLKAGS